MFTGLQLQRVANRRTASCSKSAGFLLLSEVKEILDAAIAEGLVRPVTATDAECEESFVFSEGFMDEHTADPVEERIEGEARAYVDQRIGVGHLEQLGFESGMRRAIELRLSEQRDPVKPESELSELGKQWMRPPEELIALSRMVQEASKVTVTLGSADDDARQYLCAIASLRLSRQLLKEYSGLSEQREAAAEPGLGIP